MADSNCAVCGADVQMKSATINEEEGVGLYCKKCKKYYCPKHFEAYEERIVAGVDTEDTVFHCPKGHAQHPAWG